MLVRKQIKALAKPYTDRAMIRQSDRCALGPESTPMWSNMSVVFFGESEPKSTPKDFEPSALQPNNMEDIQEWCANPGAQVWPVEIGPLYDGFARNGGNSHSMILLRFVDKAGHSHWFDARYVSAIMKRHHDPDWYYSEGRLIARNSTPVTIAADDGVEVTIPRGDPVAILREWRWGESNTAASYHNWDPDWRLCNECTQSWHTLRWAQRLDRMLPKGKRGNRLTCLNGDNLPVRRVKLGRHKYIKIASESGQGSAMISLYNGEVTQITQEATQ